MGIKFSIKKDKKYAHFYLGYIESPQNLKIEHFGKSGAALFRHFSGEVSAEPVSGDTHYLLENRAVVNSVMAYIF